MSIEVKNVTKTYKINDNQQLNIFKKIFTPDYKYIKAVDDISFNVEDGEFVGYIGSNGAGKSTTLKMLSGILTPTQGKIIVNGISPSENRKENAKRIGVVFGQRSQLLWDLPVIDTLNLYQKMYKITDKTFKTNLNKMDDILRISEFINQPARQLSLGQKMKANIVLALIHDPKILFLDEPTIGLDVLSKDNIRKMLKEINKNTRVTVMLTTHDLSDVQDLCERIILINKGNIKYEGQKDYFLDKYSTEGVVKVTFADNNDEIQNISFAKNSEEGRIKSYSFDKNIISELEAIKYIVNNYNIVDIKLEYATLEDVVKDMFLREDLNDDVGKNKINNLGYG